ncbi:hypothetical protein halTADL_0134 [Halohasta litchfieldiae]|jgi:hypothetical protein|uniref:Uncharacterized protein n=1 Tax=Halohasta litchfieldiae TaxID=1073996 RepID=A0A1H6SWD9_9EURY|nr:hypothetical protein [Halohasta litchfieldiae]ATW86956.1 hypothetical protein halTADL_0134 [Halohasta litchfieldiae]SEI71196.1 hypothetical protein SAMN05444271_10665 [Halohasta litchfieldiae]
MDLVVTTPGVETAQLRAELGSASTSDCQLVVERATRCGSTAVDPIHATRLRLAVVPCGVSLHAADRFRERLAGGQSVDGLIVRGGQRGSTVKRRLADRFNCPVTVTSGRKRGRRQYYSKR